MSLSRGRGAWDSGALRDVTNLAINYASAKQGTIPSKPNVPTPHPEVVERSRSKQARTEVFIDVSDRATASEPAGETTGLLCQRRDDMSAFDVPSPPWSPRRSADPQFVAVYSNDIFRALRNKEVAVMVLPAYLDSQPEINANMRTILFDWLVEVARKYKLRLETLFLAVSIIDRYLAIRTIARGKLQLIGGTCMLVAGKLEEIHPFEVAEFVYLMDNQYTTDEILQVESSILFALSFKLAAPTPVPFFRRFDQANAVDVEHSHLAQYIMELTILDVEMLQYPPSHLAATSIFLANKLKKIKPVWPVEMMGLTKYTEQNLLNCAMKLCTIIDQQRRMAAGKSRPEDAQRSMSLFKKFSKPEYSSVAQIIY